MLIITNGVYAFRPIDPNKRLKGVHIYKKGHLGILYFQYCIEKLKIQIFADTKNLMQLF
jgi:hypothetical protein